MRVPIVPTAAAATLAAAGACSAGYTAVNTGSSAAVNVVNTVFGGTFWTNTVDLNTGGTRTVGNITLTRVHDFGGGSPINLSGSNHTTAMDQVWTDGVVNATAQARFAGYAQNFGHFDGASGLLAGNFDLNVAVTGSGFNVSGTGVFDSSVELPGGVTEWRWGRTGNTVQSSKDSDNPDALDHMITFFVQRANGPNGWFLLFEDLNQPGSDRDFSDLGMELTIIPLPAPAFMATAGMLGLVGFRRR